VSLRPILIGYKRLSDPGYTITRLSIVPGTNQIKFEAMSRSILSWEKDWDIVPNRKSQSDHSPGFPPFSSFELFTHHCLRLQCVAKWSATMTLAEVSDGGLQININAPDPTVELSGENKDDLSYYGDYFKDSYSTAGANFRAIVESLKNALEGQERFFLPVSFTTDMSSKREEALY
jgi:hypothetical protein